MLYNLWLCGELDLFSIVFCWFIYQGRCILINITVNMVDIAWSGVNSLQPKNHETHLKTLDLHTVLKTGSNFN